MSRTVRPLPARRSLLLAGLGAATLSGCGVLDGLLGGDGGTDPAPDGGPSDGGGDPNAAPATEMPTDIGDPNDPAVLAAAELVRAGITAPAEPAASLDITGDHPLKGGKLHVWEVRSTESLTRLLWGVTHPSATQGVFSSNLMTGMPTIVVGDAELSATERTSQPGSAAKLSGHLMRTLKTPRQIFAAYAALPGDVSEVTVRSSICDGEAKLPVQRGADPVPEGTEEIPILGQSTSLDTGREEVDWPLTVTVHGVRRVKDHTQLYYSLAVPEGAEPADIWEWGYKVIGLNAGGSASQPDATFGAVDAPGQRAFCQPGSTYDEVSSTFYGVHEIATPGGPACVGVALLPAIPEDVTTVDVVLATKQLILDVPVENGLMEPAVANQHALLGYGWPTISDEQLAKAEGLEDFPFVAELREATRTGAVTDTGKGLELDAEVLFEYGKADLSAAAQAEIQRAADVLTADGTPGPLTVVGHTDSDGDPSFNMDLSQKRAQAVADVLQPLLGSGWTLTVEGKGDTEPIADNSTEEGRAKNRRVEIIPG